ncbi:hypothetical protein KC343_g63 [Hortaea werneckii]|nr:hypothetical protein KC317_g61 [Hortaea werneckii]KAI7628678.1 hypothetical protein KC346_g65 [Hortaea werneckii]KAI7638475.1 hypothetical protein KC343_g63 [Hortaea werneckii]
MKATRDLCPAIVPIEALYHIRIDRIWLFDGVARGTSPILTLLSPTHLRAMDPDQASPCCGGRKAEVVGDDDSRGHCITSSTAICCEHDLCIVHVRRPTPVSPFPQQVKTPDTIGYGDIGEIFSGRKGKELLYSFDGAYNLILSIEAEYRTLMVISRPAHLPA